MEKRQKNSTMHRGFRLGAIETGHPPVLATWEMCILAKRYSQLEEDGFYSRRHATVDGSEIR